jgi:hypothetical protein
MICYQLVVEDEEEQNESIVPNNAALGFNHLTIFVINY